MKWEELFKQTSRELKWFKDCKTFKRGKARYRELMKEHHPDKGGSSEVTKEINDEYDLFLTRAIKDDESLRPKFTDNAFGVSTPPWLDHLAYAMRLNCDIEVIGEWIWLFNISPGDVFSVIANGFCWSPKHEGYFYYDLGVQERNSRGSRRDYTTNDLRDLWGSDKKKDKLYLDEGE